MGTYIKCRAEIKRDGVWQENDAKVFPLGDFECDFRKLPRGSCTENPFWWRSYAMFGFLADVRNHSCCPPIAAPRGLPQDWLDARAERDRQWKEDFAAHRVGFSTEPYDEDHDECFGRSWLTARELLEFDYSQEFEDRRDGSHTVPVGRGRRMTLREHLGDSFFRDLEALAQLVPPGQSADDVRIVFWFS